MDAGEVARRYRLAPHPEGGRYREVFRAPAPPGGRGAVTAIYYLLEAGEVSAWHRIDAVEIWCHHAGAPLRLDVSEDGVAVETRRLAERALGGGVDAGRLRGRAGLRVLRLRTGAARLAPRRTADRVALRGTG